MRAQTSEACDRVDVEPAPEGDLRFQFGRNWRKFLSVVDQERITQARRSLQAMLGQQSLEGIRFLDVGCGSGLFSLAALSLGAAFVHSFDFDPESVACTKHLLDNSGVLPDRWIVEQGDILDETYVRGLGQFDVVYAWGVLHHTGDLQSAMRMAARAVAPGGRLFLAIYNDQGLASRVWRVIKRIYNRLPAWSRNPWVALVMAPFEVRSALGAVLRFRPMAYFAKWANYGTHARGMSRWRDFVDWVGGYPFEVAKPDDVLAFYRGRGYRLDRLATCHDWGCNEYVFVRLR